MISQLFISYSFGGLILKVEFQSPFLYFDREFGDRCFYVNYNLRLNIGILPLCCKKGVLLRRKMTLPYEN